MWRHISTLPYHKLSRLLRLPLPEGDVLKDWTVRYVWGDAHKFTNNDIQPAIHYSMGSAPVGVQCPLTSLQGEFPGYWHWLWYPVFLPVSVSIAFPFAFHISVFPLGLTLLHLPLDFIRLLFTVAVSAPRHQPSFFTRAWNQHTATVIVAIILF